ncbi:guanine deaminase [Cocleimonas sp. KMM 6892]|uniref:guanine deaminase n=1 Tax=unclassified Cocleimonas TaxID=2639732 RepID=UPI002DBCE0F2|nr:MULTISPECIES: guanine deaminase [unclassified Cocleimonas]MEB8431737.1 guanine deaminase [Cocleimonas sp. KMM 6892]MEC4715177.1 guanine deaminase [Cocleimonas sp. KMM 6895]MEC4744009.1 guanine deaminase [Cocleimonas sp. KMM 6896]
MTISSSVKDSVTAHRGEILHFLSDPQYQSSTETKENSWQYFKDGLLVIDSNGQVQSCGEAEALLKALPADAQITEHLNCLITPGFIDTHIHFPQCEIIASYGEQLLEWLETYTFPAESNFSDPEYAAEIARFFLDQLLSNGTTTALVFGTVHPQSVDAFFNEAQHRNLRMICGKVMMDRHAPDYLLDTPETSYSESKQLIEKWHNKDRLRYAVTPRFAPTSTPEQLEAAGRLLKEFPDVHFQTHLSENKKECEWVHELFPERKNYLDVYDHYDLLGKRSVFAHGIHLDDGEWQRLAETDSSISYCPRSNLFIGSGLFNLHKAQQHKVKVGLGTDVAGGDSFSILQTINEAYKIQQLQDQSLSAFQSLYMATLGGAKTLDLDDNIGNFEQGKEADFVVMDYQATPLLKFKIEQCTTFEESLFSLLMLGDDRCVKETYIMGKKYYG